MNRSISWILAGAALAALLAGAEPATFGLASAGSTKPSAAVSPATALSIDPSGLQPATASGNFNPGVLPVGSNPFGASYATWSARWWRWVLAIPAATNPLLDATGQFAGVAQSDRQVWFLAGTSGGSVTRACTVPSGRAIFLPILNVEMDYPCPDPNFQPPPGQSIADFLAEQAAFYVDHTAALDVELDGHSLGHLTDYRVRSGLFMFTGDPSLQVMDGCITGAPQPIVSDGFWLMLAPLSAGTHTLHFGGYYLFPDGSTFGVDVTYNLTVEHERRGRGCRTDMAGEPRNWGAVKQLFR